MSPQDQSDFGRERQRLIGEVAENLAKCITSLNQLNRNIEDTAAVGKGFDAVHSLWTQFADVMQSGSTADADEQPNPILPRNDETIRLPAGLAPGGGQDALDMAASQNSTGRTA
ncbi:hypothetical protein JCM11641_004325 [Rhodosporidiobolus odoratus]